MEDCDELWKDDGGNMDTKGLLHISVNEKKNDTL